MAARGRLLDDGAVGARARLGAGGGGVEIGGEERRQVAGGGVREQEPLRADRAAGVDHDGLGGRAGVAGGGPLVEGGGDVGEEGAHEVAGLVAVGPEVALEGFERWGFGVGVGELCDVVEEGGAAGGLLRREGDDVRCQWGGGW